MAVRSFERRSAGANTPTPRPSTGNGPSTSGGGWLRGIRKPRDLALLAVIALLLAAAVVGGLRGRGGDATDTPTPSSTTSPEAMPRGSVVAGAGGTRDLHGIPIGYPHTEQGGLSAAVNLLAGSASPPTFNQAKRKAITDYIYLPSYYTPTMSAAMEKYLQTEVSRLGLDPSGQVMVNGEPDPTRQLIAQSDVRLGAYKPISTSANKVVVDVWAPDVFGVGTLSDLSSVQVTWSTVRTTVVWSDGDWRIADETDSDQRVPEPALPRVLPPSFAERASLLGPGWLLTSNAVETFDPAKDWAARP